MRIFLCLLWAACSAPDPGPDAETSPPTSPSPTTGPTTVPPTETSPPGSSTDSTSRGPTGDTGTPTAGSTGDTGIVVTGPTADTAPPSPQELRDAEVCTWFDEGRALPMIAATEEAEAAQAVVVPDDTQGWSIADAPADRWLTAQVDEWMTELFVYVGPGITVDMPALVQSSAPIDLPCGVSRRSYTVHEWGPYTVHLSGAGDAFLALRQVDTP